MFPLKSQNQAMKTALSAVMKCELILTGSEILPTDSALNQTRIFQHSDLTRDPHIFTTVI